MSNPRAVIKFDQKTDGIPDGHCIDQDGNLWVAMYFGNGLIKVDPVTGLNYSTSVTLNQI